MTLDDRAADAAEPIDREEEEDRVAAESLAAGDPTGSFEQRNRYTTDFDLTCARVE
jgi:hypothetical protein